MLNTHTILRRRPELIASMMDGEAVMLDMESGHYFGLSGAGPQIWSMLESGCSVGTIVDGVKAQFAIGAGDHVDDDVVSFLHKLVDKGLVMVVD